MEREGEEIRDIGVRRGREPGFGVWFGNSKIGEDGSQRMQPWGKLSPLPCLGFLF